MQVFATFNDKDTASTIPIIKIMTSKAKHWFIILSTAILLFGCNKSEHPVPNVSFQARFDLMLPQYSGELFMANRDRYGNRAGYSGIIVYRHGPAEYSAYERFCPYDKDVRCVVTPEDGNLTAKCNCCGSEYLISSPFGADIVNGPAKYSLKPYKTRMEGMNVLVVYN